MNGTISRGRLFHQLWLHSIAVAVVGGVVVGVLPCLVTVPAFALVTAPIGAILGVLLGGTVGVPVALVGTLLLSPYPGRLPTRVVGALLAFLGAAAFDGIWWWRYGDFGGASNWLFVLPPAVGLVLSPMMVDWYIGEAGGPRCGGVS